MTYFFLLFAGAFLCNALPHIVAGVQGKPFPTPFAKPSGIGYSSPLLNFLWGALNFGIGFCLLACSYSKIEFFMSFSVPFVGAFFMGVFNSIHFGKVQKAKRLPLKGAVS